MRVPYIPNRTVPWVFRLASTVPFLFPIETAKPPAQRFKMESYPQIVPFMVRPQIFTFFHHHFFKRTIPYKKAELLQDLLEKR